MGEIDVASHEDPKQNDLFVRVSENGIDWTQNFINNQFYILQNLIEVVIASVIIFIFGWWVFLLILIATIPELFVEAKYSRDVWGIWAQRRKQRGGFLIFMSTLCMSRY